MSEADEIATIRIQDGERIVTTFRCFRDDEGQWWEESPPQSARSRNRFGDRGDFSRIVWAAETTRFRVTEVSSGAPKPTVTPDGVRQFSGSQRGRVHDFGPFRVKRDKLLPVLDKFRQAGIERVDLALLREAVAPRR